MARRRLRNLDERILNKVISHGSVEGVDRISTKRIANELKITEPTIYVHFKTKENLLLQAYEKIIKETQLPIKHDPNKSTADDFPSILYSILVLAKEKREEVIYAFEYRHRNSKGRSTKPTSSPREIYKDLWSVLASSDDSVFPEDIVQMSRTISLDTLELYCYEVASGILDPSPLLGRLLSSLLLSGIKNAKRDFILSCTDKELAEINVIRK